MARVHPIEGRATPLLLRLLNLASRHTLGQEALPFKLLAHNPKFLLPFVLMSRFSQGKTKLAPELRTLAMYLVAERNHCAWCLAFGRYQGQKQRLELAKLLAITDYATDPRFSEVERAVLRYADEMTQVGGRVSDTTFAALRRYLSEREIVELTVAIATEHFYNRINAALEVNAQGFCAIPVTPPVRQTTWAAGNSLRGAWPVSYRPRATYSPHLTVVAHSGVNSRTLKWLSLFMQTPVAGL